MALRFDGVGPVRFGMTLQEVNEALGERFVRPSDPDEHACFYVDSKKLPHVSLMIEDGKFARADVSEGVTRTEQGVKIGDSEARVKSVYGNRVQVERHAYDEQGHYLTVLSNDHKAAFRFETDGKKVTSFYAGTSKAIEYIEGCQ